MTIKEIQIRRKKREHVMDYGVKLSNVELKRFGPDSYIAESNSGAWRATGSSAQEALFNLFLKEIDQIIYEQDRPVGANNND